MSENISPEINETPEGELIDIDIQPVSAKQRLEDGYAQMLAGIRSWGRTLLILGVIYFFIFGFFSSSWGLLLVLVGLASFYFRDAAMFVVYGVTLLWATLMNLLSGSSAWLVFSLLQIYWTYQVFRQFFQYRKIQTDYATLLVEEGSSLPRSADRIFPWGGCLMGFLAPVGLVLTFVGLLFYIAGTGAEELSEPILLLGDFIFGLLQTIAILGVGVSLASLLSRFKPTIVNVLGLVGSVLGLGIFFGFMFTGG